MLLFSHQPIQTTLVPESEWYATWPCAHHGWRSVVGAVRLQLHRHQRWRLFARIQIPVETGVCKVP